MSKTETQVPKSSKELCQIDVAISLCSKPNLKELYTRPEGSQEVWLFLWKQHVHVVPFSRGQEVIRIELAGTHAALQNFYDTFLIDEPVQARELHYRPEGNAQEGSIEKVEANSHLIGHEKAGAIADKPIRRLPTGSRSPLPKSLPPAL